MTAMAKRPSARLAISSTSRAADIPLPMMTSGSLMAALPRLASFGGNRPAVRFADHELRERRVGGSPGGGQILSPAGAEPALERPQQRLADRRVVPGGDAVGDVTLRQRTRGRQYGVETGET